MLHPPYFSIRLLICFGFYLLITGLVNTAHAAQNNTTKAPQNDPLTIYGKVTEVITTDSFTYVEVETDKEKVWAAGPVTSVNKGDMISFSNMMPMQNFHSKTLGRDFAVLYITNGFTADGHISDNGTSAISSTHAQIKPGTTVIAGMSGEVEIGGYLREATLYGLNVKSKTFSVFKGKPLIINVWASWCGPCRAEMGSLERLAQRYSGKDFNIIGISTDDYRNKAVDLIKQTNISFDNFIDHKLLLENMLGAKTIPLTVLVDADGRILNKVHGAREWDSPETIDAIAKVFKIKLMH